MPDKGNYRYDSDKKQIKIAAVDPGNKEARRKIRRLTNR